MGIQKENSLIFKKFLNFYFSSNYSRAYMFWSHTPDPQVQILIGDKKNLIEFFSCDIERESKKVISFNLKKDNVMRSSLWSLIWQAEGCQYKIWVVDND